MRISDWSSDVCSSDLAPVRGCAPAEQGDERAALDRVGSDHAGKREEGRRIVDVLDRCRDPRAGTDVAGILDQEGGAQRSEERRGGKEGVSACRSRWSQYRLNKNNKQEQRVTKN